MCKSLKFFTTVVALAAVLTLFSLIYVFIVNSIPNADGNASIPSLSAPVDVVRDRNAVAHIEGTDLLDVVAAQGFVHAQERLWQMELFRITGEGRLAEVFGDTMVDADEFLRSLDFAGYSQKSYSGLQPRSKAILEAYASGVNAYLQRQSGMLEPALPPEFQILRHQPEPWQPWHSLLTIKVMDLTLGSNMRQEITRLALAAKGLAPAEIDDIERYADSDHPPPLPDLRKLYGFPERLSSTVPSSALSLRRLIASKDYDLPWPTGVTASNNWVIGGSRTLSGKVLLANDPHLSLTAPSTWYLNHLSWQENGKTRNLIGASLPSVPLVLLGRNEHIAWGFTTSNLDAQDVYIEKLNPQHPDEYLTEDGWRQFEAEPVTIKVANGDAVTFVRHTTRHGPVLPAHYRELQAILPQGYVAALQWTSLTDHDTTFDALCQFPLAESVAQFKQALRPMVSPMQTIVVGDIEGNIGKIAPAKIPLRRADNPMMGRAPVPGWLSQYQWQGLLDYPDWPNEENPDDAVFYSANYKFVAENYPHHITFDWERVYRHHRIKRLIDADGASLDMNSMRKMLADDYSEPLQHLRSIALRILPADTTVSKQLLQQLQLWDGRMRSDAAEPLIMMAWFKRLGEVLLLDELQEAYPRIARSLNIDIVLSALQGKTNRQWCDDITTQAKESCADQVKTSLESALASLRQDYGSDWRLWRWGQAHIAYNEHRPFAKVKLLASIFNIETESAGGPYTLLRGMTNLNAEHPFYNRSASTYRAIYDFADLNHSLFMQNTGQSGHFLSPHYADYAKLWAHSEFIPMWTQKADYRKDAIGVWHFRGEQ